MKDNNTHTYCRFFIDPDRETTFLRSMNRRGWRLESIGAGMLYRFSRSKPREYVTLIHTAPKEQHARLTELAAENGLEAVPHRFDGMNDRLYLTGKRDACRRDFIDPDESRRQTLRSVAQRMRSLVIVYSSLLLLFISLIFAFYLRPLYVAVSGGSESGLSLLLPFIIILGALTVIFLITEAVLLFMLHRIKNKLTLT